MFCRKSGLDMQELFCCAGLHLIAVSFGVARFRPIQATAPKAYEFHAHGLRGSSQVSLHPMVLE